ncbi:MAG: BMC domain-containing protein [Eubacteriales bacterium]|nr:BMC domain-containing protein [Eubacteriales bacterium]
MIELYGYLAAVEALDSALKAANVSSLGATKVGGGLVTVMVEGDVGAVKASMDAAATAAERVGRIISVHVIPRPHQELDSIIKPQPPVTPAPKSEPAKPVEEVKPEAPKPVVKEEAPKAEKKAPVKKAEKKTETEVKKTVSSGSVNLEALDSMTVPDLRKLARDIGIDNMTKEQIRFSKKTELIQNITEFVKREK